MDLNLKARESWYAIKNKQTNKRITHYRPEDHTKDLSLKKKN